MVLDFVDCGDVGSRVVDLVAGVAKLVEEAGGSVEVLNVSDQMSDVLKVCNLDRVVKGVV